MAGPHRAALPFQMVSNTFAEGENRQVAAISALAHE
jgi:hypothetical protein